MFLLRRAIPFISGLAIFASFLAILNISPLTLYWFLAIGIVPVIFVSIILWRLVRPLSKSEKIHLILLPAFLSLGGFLFVSFNAVSLWNYAAAIGISALVVFFGEHIFTYLWNPAAYEPYSIEQISRVLQYGILFLFSSFIFFIIIVGLPFIIVSLGGAAVAVLCGISFFIKQKIAPKDYYPLALILFFLFAQIFAVVALFPFDPKVAALLITIAFYVFTGIVRQKFHRTESLSRVQGYAAIGAASTALLLLTARWR